VGNYTELLGPNHILYISCLIVAAFLLFRFKEFIYKNRKQFTVGILIVGLCQQVLQYSMFIVLPSYDLSNSLPLHISRINMIISITFLITKNEKLQKFILYFSAYSWLSFLYPEGIDTITHPLGISFLINHLITLLMPYYSVIAYQNKLQTTGRNKAFMWIIIYTIAMYFFNPLVGGNYFFIVDPHLFGFLPDIIYIPLMWGVSYFLFMVIEFIYKMIEPRLLQNKNKPNSPS